MEKYGVSVEEYELLNNKCGNKCEICGEQKEYSLCVDHDHNTGKIRGLLCKDCNVAIGRTKDNISILNNAIEYLLKNN